MAYRATVYIAFELWGISLDRLSRLFGQRASLTGRLKGACQDRANPVLQAYFEALDAAVRTHDWAALPPAPRVLRRPDRAAFPRQPEVLAVLSDELLELCQGDRARAQELVQAELEAVPDLTQAQAISAATRRLQIEADFSSST